MRTDGAGYSHAFVEHMSATGLEYSVGYAVTEDVREAIRMLPEWAWTQAIDADGGHRDGAQVTEITDVLTEALRLRAAARRRERVRTGQRPSSETSRRSWPAGMRIVLRRERPHPGSQLEAFEERDGYRHQAFAANTTVGQIAFLKARHRAHARVEDRIRQAQAARLHRLPSRLFAINAAWLQLARIATDLLAWTQTILLTSDDADTRDLAEGWPWAHTLARAFILLRRIPVPV